MPAADILYLVVAQVQQVVGLDEGLAGHPLIQAQIVHLHQPQLVGPLCLQRTLVSSLCPLHYAAVCFPGDVHGARLRQWRTAEAATHVQMIMSAV